MISFKQKILDFLEQWFGKNVSQSYLLGLKRQLKIKDLDNCSDLEKKKVLLLIFNKTFAKFMRPEDLKKQKLIVFHQIFGMEKAMELLGENEFTIQPITFLYFVFGDHLGEGVVKLGEKVYQKKNIKGQDEFEQVVFVKRLLLDMFKDFPKDYTDEINVRFLLFLKVGEQPERTLLRVLAEKDPEKQDKLRMDIIRSVMGYYFENSPEMFSEIGEQELMDLIMRLGVSHEERQTWLVRIRNEKESGGKAEGMKKISVSSPDKTGRLKHVKEVLSSYVGSSESSRMVSEAIDSLGIDDLDSVSLSQRMLFYSTLVANTSITRFSTQKRIIIEDKLKTVLA
ncbi:MAG: hypothetical protein ACLFUO_06910 [Candidatus Woesearchaeota archaeon]